VYESAVVVGRSMLPTLQPGEYLLACKSACLDRPPRRGEIVTFRTPGDERSLAIKRVIGLPGDWVQMWGTQVFVNGGRLNEPYARAVRIRGYAPAYVPPGSIYVLGDNRDDSEDSRVWGPVPLASVRGMALFTYFPLRHAQRMR
jgi:signal peptidase I